MSIKVIDVSSKPGIGTRPTIDNRRHVNSQNGNGSAAGHSLPPLGTSAAAQARIIISEPKKFTPYSDPTPGKVKVHLKGLNETLIKEYEPEKIPNPSETPRSEIKLKGVRPKILKQARLVAREILEEWKKAHAIKAEYKRTRKAYKTELGESFRYKVKATEADGEVNGKRKIKVRYRSTEAKTAIRERLAELKAQSNLHPFCNLYGKNTTVSMDSFTQVFYEKTNGLISDGKVEGDLLDDAGFKSLVAFLCTRKNKKNGFTALPFGFFDYTDPELHKKIEMLGRYFVVNVSGVDTVEKAEQFKNWSGCFAKNGLQLLNKIISGDELLKYLFPGYPIRSWHVYGTNKWQGEGINEQEVKSVLTQACKEAFLDQEGVVGEDLTINLDRVAEVDWGKVFWDKKYGLRGAIGQCQFFASALDGLELAVPGIIGNKPGQIPRAKFKYPNKWTEGNALGLIDELTRYIVEDKLKLVDEEGRVSVSKIKEVPDWGTQYNDECAGCLRRAGVGTAYEALKRVYPALFGWGEDQIEPGSIRFNGMWKGEEGIKLFKLRFAKSIHSVFEQLKEAGVEAFEDHEVRFQPNLANPLYITRSDFINLKNYYIIKKISWLDHFLAFGLTAGYMDIAGGTENAFELLLGKKNGKTSCFGNTDIPVDDVIERTPMRTQLISDLLKDLGQLNTPTRVSVNGIYYKTTGNTKGDKGIKGIIHLEKTCLSGALEYRPPSDVSEITSALYEAFAASIIPSPTKDKSGSGLDRSTALEKVLIAKYPAGTNEGKFILSDRRLSHLLKFLRDTVIDDVNIDNELKAYLKNLIDRVRHLKKPHDTPRDLLIAAAETGKSNPIKNNAFNTLNQILEHLNELVAKHEMCYLRLNNSNTVYYENIFSQIACEDADNEEPLAEVEEEIDEAETAVEFQETDETEVSKPDDDDDTEILSLELTEFLDETTRICTGTLTPNGDAKIKEDGIIETLKYVARDKTHFRKHATDFLHMASGGDLSILIRMLIQIEERSRSRSSDRFDYPSLRAKALPAMHINSIAVDPILMNGDETHEVSAASSSEDSPRIVSLENIDEELFSLMPEWWPMSEKPRKTPLAIPLLYWNNVAYVGVPEGFNPSMLKDLSDKLKCRVEHRIIKPESWRELLNFYTAHAKPSGNLERGRLRTFISKAEEELIIQNVASLRLAALRYAESGKSI